MLLQACRTLNTSPPKWKRQVTRPLVSPNAQNEPTRKRQKTAMSDTLGHCCPASPAQNGGVFAAMNKLSKLVLEHHPLFNSKLERMLEDIFNELEPEVSATVRKEKNEESCPIYKVSNDGFKHIFGHVGEKQYGFVACVSDRFHQVYADMFGDEKLMSAESAVTSVSCAKLYLDMGRPNCNTRSKQLF